MKAMTTLAALATALPVTAWIATPDWHRVAGGQGATFYVDLASVRPNGQWTAASEITVYDEVSKNTGAKAVRMNNEYDCVARRMRYLRLIAYDAEGKLKADQDHPGGDRTFEIKPGTNLAGVADFVCNVNRRPAVRVADPLAGQPE